MAKPVVDWNKAAAGIRAFYFRDPDGHALQLIENSVAPAKDWRPWAI